MTATASKERFQQLHELYRTGQYSEAETALSAALRTAPKDPNWLHLAALVAEAQGALPRATMLFGRALQANPDWLEAEFNLARILSSQQLYSDAIALMTKVSRKRPDLPQVWESLAKFQQLAGDIPAAIAHWQKVLELAPDQQEWRTQYILLTRQICDWSIPIENIVKLSPQAVTVLADDPAIQMQAAQRYAQQRFGTIEPMPAATWAQHERIRIGYLSSDFHAHATAYLLAELFSLHNRKNFEVFVYSYGVDDQSDIRSRIKNEAEHFTELNKLTPHQAAERIRQDEIDILVDLKGYTRGNRLEILAYRPAPVQIHWLGYPGTLGTSFIDYFVGDETIIPIGNKQFFKEQLIRLPHSYQINDRKRTIAEPLSRTAYGLPEEALVLASFNQTYKITPEIFAVWCEILLEVPEAVLWLYQSNNYAPDNLRAAAAKYGIDASRLILAPAMPLAEHLARYSHVDLALDTFPVGGHTTTSDALWAGTPVVTLAGQSFISRVAASLLTATDLPQLIATDSDSYKKLVLELIRDPAARSDLKQHLQSARDVLPLFDTPRFVKDWETALLNINQNKPQ